MTSVLMIKNILKIFIKTISKFCANLCPINCINDEFIITNKFIVTNSDRKLWKFTLIWDYTKPLIINKETPVMTFNDYFCYIGGLIGMWFGISANQLFDYSIIIFKQIIQYSLNLIYFILDAILKMYRTLKIILMYISQQIFLFFREFKIQYF